MKHPDNAIELVICQINTVLLVCNDKVSFLLSLTGSWLEVDSAPQTHPPLPPL